MRIPKLGSLFLVLLLILLFEMFVHMWGPGISDYSPEHHLWMTVEGLRTWMQIIGFLCVAFLLFIERKGSGIGRYWISFRFNRPCRCIDLKRAPGTQKIEDDFQRIR